MLDRLSTRTTLPLPLNVLRYKLSYNVNDLNHVSSSDNSKAEMRSTSTPTNPQNILKQHQMLYCYNNRVCLCSTVLLGPQGEGDRRSPTAATSGRAR